MGTTITKMKDFNTPLVVSGPRQSTWVDIYPVDGSHLIASVYMHGSDINKANADRLSACWNAMIGIDDPAAFVAEAKAVAEDTQFLARLISNFGQEVGLSEDPKIREIVKKHLPK